MGALFGLGKLANAVTVIWKVLAKLWPVLRGLLARYPALAAAALNVAVGLAARFGFHVSATGLVTILSVLSAILGAWVHSQVSPVKPQHAEHAKK